MQTRISKSIATIAALLMALALVLAIPAHAQYTTITATNISDGSGAKLATGTMCWVGTNNAGQPINYRAGTSGPTTTDAVCRDVVTGAVATTYKGATLGTLQVADSTLTTPLNVCYKVTVVNSATGKVVLGSYAGSKTGYDCVQPSGATWSFDSYTPAGTPGIVQITGPVGPQGPAGPATVNTDSATIVPPATNPSVSNAGSLSAAIFHFNLPRAPQFSFSTATTTPAVGNFVTPTTDGNGDISLAFSIARPRTFSIGTVTTGPAGGVASASVTPDSNGDQVLSFNIPQGANGTTSTTGATGDFAVTGKLTAKETNQILDASNFFATDMCGSINAAWTYAVGKGWKSATVDARGYHGSQACSTNMFQNVPTTIGIGCQFNATLQLGDVEVRTDVTQVIPCNSTLKGTANNNIGNGVTTIRTSNAYYTQAPLPYGIVQMGYSGSTWPGGGTPPEGARIEHVFINGNPVTGLNSTPTTCLINQYSQENSGGSFLAMDGCLTAFERQVDPTSSIFGALNDGPWEHIHVNFNGILAADAPNATCIKNGTARSGLGTTRGIRDISCNISGLSVQPNEAVRVSGTGFLLEHAHFEGFKDTIVLGEDFAASAFQLRDISTVSFAGTFQGQNVIRNAAGHTNIGLISGVSAGGSSGGMNNFKDDTDGYTISASALNFMPNFALPRAAVTPITAHSTSYTLTSADDGSLHSFNGFGSSATATLPATVAAGWTVRILNYNPSGTLTIDPSGHFMNGSVSTITLPAGNSSAWITTNGTNYYASLGTLSTAPVVALSDLQNPTASKTINMSGFGLTLQGSAAQSVSMLTLSGSGSNASATTHLIVSASGTGTNEKTFSFTNPKSNFTQSSAAGDLQFQNIGNATAGVHLPSFMYQTTAKCYNGTASTADSAGWQIVYEGTSNTPLSNFKTTFSGGCGGVRMIDFTTAAGVRALSIRSNTSANTDLGGELAFSAATTASYTFAGSYGSHPECIAQPQFDEGSGVRHWITYTGATALTINFSSAVTGNVSFLCHGRN